MDWLIIAIKPLIVILLRRSTQYIYRLSDHFLKLKITCPVLRQMCRFSGNCMDWDEEWCECFGSVSWCPRSIGKICRGLKKLFNIVCSFFGFALTICFFLIFTQILDDIILKCTQCFVCTFYKIKINIHKNVN